MDFIDLLKRVILEMKRNDKPTHHIEWADVWELVFTETKSGWVCADGYGIQGYGKSYKKAVRDWVKNAEKHVALAEKYERTFSKQNVRLVAAMVAISYGADFDDQLMRLIDKQIEALWE